MSGEYTFEFGVCSLPKPAAPTEGATMKDSHGQTVRAAECPYCHGEGDCGCWCHKPTSIVQDYREYTADEILHGIVKFTEQAGWGDPANLGHWLGAAQRWEKRAGVR